MIALATEDLSIVLAFLCVFPIGESVESMWGSSNTLENEATAVGQNERSHERQHPTTVVRYETSVKKEHHGN